MFPFWIWDSDTACKTADEISTDFSGVSYEFGNIVQAEFAKQF